MDSSSRQQFLDALTQGTLLAESDLDQIAEGLVSDAGAGAGGESQEFPAPFQPAPVPTTKSGKPTRKCWQSPQRITSGNGALGRQWRDSRHKSGTKNEEQKDSWNQLPCAITAAASA